MKKTRKTISQKWNIFRLFFIRGRHCSRLHLRQRKIFQGPSWNMGHRVPPAISRYMYKYIYMHIFFFLAFTQRGRNEKKKENATSREKYMIYHVDYSKRNLFETKQRTRSHEFIRVFFFFSMLPPGNIRRGKCSLFTWNISVFEFNIVSLILRIGNFFKSPEIFFFFPDENPVFFFLQPRRFWLNNSFVMEIVDEMELESFFSLYIFLSLISLLIRLLKKKKKKQTHLV